MRLLLAPMEGLLDYMLRDVLTQVGGIDLCVTEFIRITNTLLPKRSILRIAPELASGSKTPAGTPVKVQILGSDPVCMAENAARIAEMGAFGVDLNFGCPAKTVNRHRGGAVLLDEPELVYAIAIAVRHAVPKSIPVSAKMRLGCNDASLGVACAQAFESAGMEEIVVHGRTKIQGYKPPAYWDQIANIREAVTIPVVANGEVWTVEDYWRCRKESGCDTVMIGRGMIQNPALAHMIRNDSTRLLCWHEMQPLLLHYWQHVVSGIESKHRAGRMKQWLNYLRELYPEAQETFTEIRKLTKTEEIENAMFSRSRAA